MYLSIVNVVHLSLHLHECALNCSIKGKRLLDRIIPKQNLECELSLNMKLSS
jgi:hypothetical protein